MAELTGLQKQYILHWGEMGTKWGINRTVAQIHALLYLSPKPVPAEEIAKTLQRGAVQCEHVDPGAGDLGDCAGRACAWDRREHYESMRDVWEMFRLVIEQTEAERDRSDAGDAEAMSGGSGSEGAGRRLHARAVGSDGRILRGGDGAPRSDETAADRHGEEVIADGDAGEEEGGVRAGVRGQGQ